MKNDSLLIQKKTAEDSYYLQFTVYYESYMYIPSTSAKVQDSLEYLQSLGYLTLVILGIQTKYYGQFNGNKKHRRIPDL